MSKDDTSHAQECKRWSLPTDFVALTRDEYISQQEFIRDKANEILISALTSEKPKTRGLLAWQELSLRADAALQRARAEVVPEDDEPGTVDGISIGYELSLPVPTASDTPEA